MRVRSVNAGKVIEEVSLTALPTSLAFEDGMERLLIVGNIQQGTENTGQVTILNFITGGSKQVISMGHDLRSIAVNEKAHQAFIADAGLFADDVGGIPIGNGYVYVLDTQTLQITKTIEVGSIPNSIFMDNEVNHLFVLCWCFNATNNQTTDDNLYMLDLKNGEFLQKISVGHEPLVLAGSPLLHRVYVTTDNTLVVIDSLTGKIVNHIETGASCWSVEVDEHLRIIFVVNFNPPRLVVLNALSGAFINAIPLEEKPLYAAVDNDTRQIFITHGTIMGTWDKLTIISYNSEGLLSVIDSIDIGGHPNHIKIDKQTGLVYVTCILSKELYIIDADATPITHTVIPLDLPPINILIGVEDNRVFITHAGNPSKVTILDAGR